MKSKKLGSLICFILVLSVFIPAISIAFARKPDRGPLEKIVFIHYRKGYGKPEGTPGNGPDKDNGDDDGEEEGYYTFLVKGAKWKKTPIDYVIDTDNTYGLTEAFITGAISASAEEWDDNTSIELFDNTYTVDQSSWDVWEDVHSNRINELFFGDYPQDGVIAVAVVWGYFGGRPSQREIVEFDIMFDTDYNWGNATENTKVMDLQNIATHEIGHGAGLGDLYKAEASEETMYGYSSYGEIIKRDLYLGDIAGIQELYG